MTARAAQLRRHRAIFAFAQENPTLTLKEAEARMDAIALRERQERAAFLARCGTEVRTEAMDSRVSVHRPAQRDGFMDFETPWMMRD